MKPSRIVIAPFFVLFLLLLLTSPHLLAASEVDCRRLLDANLPGTSLTSAELQAGNTFVAPGTDRAMEHPAFCRVAGVTEPAIRFEVWLPLADWNGKYQGVGNGGMAGTISYGAMGGRLAARLRHGEHRQPVMRPGRFPSMLPGLPAGPISLPISAIARCI